MTEALITSPNLDDPDGVYERLLAVHDGLSDEESAALNARLILILVNHIGNPRVLSEALALARAAGHQGD